MQAPRVWVFPWIQDDHAPQIFGPLFLRVLGSPENNLHAGDAPAIGVCSVDVV